MELSEEELKAAEQLGASSFSLKEVAIFLEKELEDITALYNDHSSAFYKRYQKGLLETKLAINKAIIDLAKRNSSPAQTEALRFISKTEVDNKNYEE